MCSNTILFTKGGGVCTVQSGSEGSIVRGRRSRRRLLRRVGDR